MKVWARLLAVAVAIVSHTADAAINQWTGIGPYGGGALKLVYNRASPSTVYLTSVGGFSRSTDGGVTWQMAWTDSMNSPVDLAVDPSNPSRLYVVFVDPPYLMSSADAGKTLTAVSNFPVNLVNPYQIQVSADGQTLFVTAGSRIICSTDRGQTWAERTVVDADPATRVLHLIIDPVDANTLYAGVAKDNGENGIFVTHDGARTWTQSVWSTNNQHYVNGFAISPLDPGTVWASAYDGLWVSHDRAVSWNRTNFYAGRGYGTSAVAVDPQNPAVIYATNPFGLILKSIDSGSNWGNVTGNNFVEQPWTLAVNPVVSGNLLVGGLGGVWGTSNDGATWASQIQGLVASDVLGFSASPATDRIYFNTNGSNVGYVAGGTESTTSINADAIHRLVGNIPSDGSAAFQVSSVMSQPGADGHLYVSLLNGLAVSPDGGDSWSLKSVDPTGSQQLPQMSTWPGLPQTILAGGSVIPFRSTDGGNLWSAMTAGLPSGTTLSDILTAPSDSTIAYGLPLSFQGGSGVYGLYRTTDSGSTWAPVGNGATSDIYPSAVDPHDARILYARNRTDLLKSTDGGNSFSVLNWDAAQPGLPAITIDPLHTNILYAMTNIRISRSVDGGDTWQVLPPSPAAPTGSYWIPNDLIVDPNRPSDVLVATGRNGIFKMTVAPDLALSLQTSGALIYGLPFTYQYKAVNNGPYDATGVHVLIGIPGGVTNQAVTTSDGSCTVTAGTADCTLPILRVGKSFSVSLAATAPTTAAMLQISGTVSGDQPDADGNNNAIVTRAQVTDGADLSVAATAPGSASVGAPVSATFTVSNSGPASAAAVLLSYQASAGTTVSSVSATAGSCTSTSSGLVSCTLGNLAANATAAVTITATASAVGSMSASATVTSDTPDPVTANGSASSTTTVSASSSSSSAGSSSSGGGGGGSVSVDLVVALALLLFNRRRKLRGA